jgi:hypothetical protein
MAAVAAANSRETMRKYATFQILAKSLLHKWRGRVMIALPVKLPAATLTVACTQGKPSLTVP